MIKKNILVVVLISVFVFTANAYAGTSRVELTTFYPARYGEYTSLKATGADVLNTNFALQAQGNTGTGLVVTNANNVGIGTTTPFVNLHVYSGADTAPLVLETWDTNDVFSVLPWAGLTLLSSGVYYKNGAWVHNSAGVNNCLFTIGSAGGAWYASNNSLPSWNVANNVTLWNQAGVLNAPSSRNLKENFTPLNYDDVFQKILQLDISRWNYKAEGRAITHIGPVSEDFRDLFKTGDSDKRIALIDEGGVALAGIKALSHKFSDLERSLTVDEKSGSVGIGAASPTSRLQVVGLPVHANNASATAAGLTPGAFYRTGGDPDYVYVVH